MKRYQEYMPRILKHEGGFVNHPKDPGGATNHGVTIGTLRKLGIDKDGDGDSDIVDLRLLTAGDAGMVFKRFYGDAVQADFLPRGLDYAMADFSVNSGPTRAAEHLQRILGVTVDGHIGPATLAAVAKRDTAELIEALHKSRLRFLRNLKTWPTFGRGWQARVDDVRKHALADQNAIKKKTVSHHGAAGKTLVDQPLASKPVDAHKPPETVTKGFWASLFIALMGIIKGR